MTANNDGPAHNEETEEASGPSETDVVRYLLTHPEFLVDHIEVLRSIAPRKEWSGDSVVDLQSVMMDRSQEALDDLRSAAQSVIATSRSNMSIQTRTHAAVTAVLDVASLEDVVHVVAEDWPQILDVDVASLGFEFSCAPFPALIDPNIRQLPPGTIRHLLGSDLNVRLFDDMVDDGTLFGEAAGIARSAALARIKVGFELPPGLLSLGAREETFMPGQGTELLAFLSDVLASTVRRCLTRSS